MARKDVTDGRVVDDMEDCNDNFIEIYAANAALAESIATLNAASACPVSTDDTTPGYLSDKLTAGPGVKHEILSPGGDESLQISTLSNTAQSVTAVAALSIDLSLGHVIILDHAVNVTSLAFTNVPTTCEVILYRDGGIAAGLEWGNISFLPESEPVFNSKTESIIRLFTPDAGTTWKAFTQNIQKFNGYAIGHGTSPFVSIYDHAGVKITNPSTLPTGTVYATAIDPTGEFLACGHNTTPFVTIYNTSDWSKVADPSTLPTGVGYSVAFNHDGSLLAVGHGTTPFITIYNTSDWSKVADPSILPTGAVQGVSFNHDGSLLACGHSTSPYVTIYNTSDWSKVTNPSTLPTGAGYGVAFNHDGSLLVVAHATTPFVTIYNTSDWSKVTDPDGLPTGNATGCHFNSDGTKLAVSHTTTPFITVYTVADWSKDTAPSNLPGGNATGVRFNDDGSLMGVTWSITPYFKIYNTDLSDVTAPTTLPTGDAQFIAFSLIALED